MLDLLSSFSIFTTLKLDSQNKAFVLFGAQLKDLSYHTT